MKIHLILSMTVTALISLSCTAFRHISLSSRMYLNHGHIRNAGSSTARRTNAKLMMKEALMSPVRVRFAPSPTGKLFIPLHTACPNYRYLRTIRISL